MTVIQHPSDTPQFPRPARLKVTSCFAKRSAKVRKLTTGDSS
jgi:hypothetical protein